MDLQELNLDSLKSALIRLKDSWKVYAQKKDDPLLSDIIADSCVKRFEYSMETSLKLMRKYLKLAYAKEDKELTVNNIFRFMEGYELIQDWEKWKYYYAKRNDTSYEYNIEKARELLGIIPKFIEDLDFLLHNLEQALSDEQTLNGDQK